MAAMMAMIAMTIMSSMRVKPLRMGCLLVGRWGCGWWARFFPALGNH